MPQLEATYHVEANNDHLSIPSVVLPSVGGLYLLASGHGDYNHVVTAMAFTPSGGAGQALTKLAARFGNPAGSNGGNLELWGLVPAAGGVTGVFAGVLSAFDYAALILEVWSGVDPAAPVAAIYQATGLTLAGIVADSSKVIADRINLWGAATSAIPDSSQIQDAVNAIGSGSVLVAGASHKAGPSSGTATMQWARVGSASDVALLAAVLNPGPTVVTRPGAIAIDGKLRITLPDNKTGFARRISTQTWDLTSSHFDVTLEDAGAQAAGRVARIGGADQPGAAFTGNALYIDVENGTATFKKVVAGAAPATIGSIAYNATNHKRFRLRHASGTVYAETTTLADSAWASPVVIASTAALGFTPNAIYMRLEGGNTLALPTDEIVFDDVNPAVTGTKPLNNGTRPTISESNNVYTVVDPDANWTGDTPQTPSYQWYRGAPTATDPADASLVPIPGAIFADYPLAAADAGTTHVVGVSRSNAAGSSAEVRSLVQAAVASADAPGILALAARIPPGDGRPMYDGSEGKPQPFPDGTWRTPTGTLLDKVPTGWKVAGAFDRYQFYRDLVAELGAFADAIEALRSATGTSGPSL